MAETKYKQTETKCVEIGEICSLTDFTAAGSFADIASNVKYITDHVGYAQLIRTVDLKNNFNNRDSFVYVDKHAFDYLWRVNLDNEALVLPNVGNCGEVYYITPDMLPHTHNVLGPNAILLKTTDASIRFLYYFFMTNDFQAMLSTIIAPTGQTKYNKTAFKNLQISLPSIAEQHAIASALTSVDNLIASLDKLITKTQSVKEGAMQQLLTGLNTEDVTWKPLYECLGYEQPARYIVKSSDYYDAGVPVLTAGQSFILGYTKETDGVFEASRECPVIIFDDFTTSFHWVEFKFKVKSSAMKMLRPISKDISFKYVHYAMNCINYEPVEHSRQWISMYSKFTIPIPSIETQHRIASTLTAIDDQVSALEAKRKKYEMVKVGMMQQLLTGKIRLK